MENRDKEISCKECGYAFVWSIGEQNFLTELLEKRKLKDEKGETRTEIQAPIRCKECRTKRKASYAEYNKTKQLEQ